MIVMVVVVVLVVGVRNFLGEKKLSFEKTCKILDLMLGFWKHLQMCVLDNWRRATFLVKSLVSYF